MQTETPSSLTVRAYAKINLTLDVFSKRADGYHGVASVMQTIGLSDTLHLAMSDTEGIQFSCDAPSSIPVPNDPTNLVYRAAQNLIEASKESGKPTPKGVSLRLEKRVPSQAGLGGGSSDAAAALRGLNALCEWGWSDKELIAFSSQLGSDVPFFILGGTVVARGRGEMLTPLADAPPLSLVVVKPDIGVSTGWAYSALDSIEERASHRATKRMEEALALNDTGRFLSFQSNDFERVVFEQVKELFWLHDELIMAGAQTAHLCGSGSAVYGVAKSQEEAQRITRLLLQKYPLTFATRTLSRAEVQASY